FMGSTNLLEGSTAGDGRILIRGRPFVLDGAGTAAGERVLVSVRPEDAHLEQAEASDENSLPGTVVFVRDLGELFECYVDCQLGNHVIVAGSPRERMDVVQGDRVAVRFPPEACVVVRP
ncbi:MAG: TOBE domain-containing protein, partial [Actinomycetota bacterium]